MNKRKVGVAIGQMLVEPLAKEANEAKILALIDEAANQGADIVVLPEMAVFGFDAAWSNDVDAVRKELLSRAEPVPGAFTNKVLERARLHNTYVFFSMFARGAEEELPVLYNTGVFAMPSGEVAIYRKMHLSITPFGDENSFVKQGDQFKVVETDLGKIGLLICHDITQPEAARVLTVMGAEIILHPYAWPEAGCLRYESLIPARAVENQLYLASSGQCGPHFYGHSRLVDFAGKELIKFGREEGVKTAMIHLDAELRWRRDHLPYFKTRRPAKYGILSAEEDLYEKLTN
jgi:predicted amidohydrolase